MARSRHAGRSAPAHIPHHFAAAGGKGVVELPSAAGAEDDPDPRPAPQGALCRVGAASVLSPRLGG